MLDDRDERRLEQRAEGQPEVAHASLDSGGGELVGSPHLRVAVGPVQEHAWAQHARPAQSISAVASSDRLLVIVRQDRHGNAIGPRGIVPFAVVFERQCKVLSIDR